MALWQESIFYADSDFKTTTHVNAINNNLIPTNIIWMFANTPMWPLESDAYWIYVPNVQQLEKECGARALLHAMLMVSSSVPHDSLLCLQNIPKKDSKILNKLCRQWVNQIFNSLETNLIQHIAAECAIAIRQARLYESSQAW